MTPSPGPGRGAEVLRRLLRERTFDLRTLDPPGFRRWLDGHLARWSRDPVFAQRSRIRDLRRAHPRLRELEAEVGRAEDADRATAAYERLDALETEVRGARQAIAGLSAALADAAEGERSRLEAKLERFRVRHRALEEEQEEYTRGSAERQMLLRLRERLAAVRAGSGVGAAEAELKRLQRERGRGSGRAGAEFERFALALTGRHLLPEISRRTGEDEARVKVLRGVALGAVDLEIDQVVVRVPRDEGGKVEVLALVEVKRNINDLAHGFRRRQLDIDWLRGDARRYDPEHRRNRAYPTGHFDREVEHLQEGRLFRFGPDSFAGLARDPATGRVLRGLYLVTREGSLWGVNSTALARISHRVSTDEAWDPASTEYLETLLRWCRSLADPLEAPDVLRLYASSRDATDRVLIVPR